MPTGVFAGVQNSKGKPPRSKAKVTQITLKNKKVSKQIDKNELEISKRAINTESS